MAAPLPENPGISMSPSPQGDQISDRKRRIERKLGFPALGDDASVDDRLERLEDRLTTVAGELRALRFSLDGYVRGLHRLLLLDGDQLPFPQRLTVNRGGISSQMDEDGITLSILHEIGIESRRFVEVGSGVNGGNSGFLARELGFSGLMLDADPVCIEVIGQTFDRSRVTSACEWITAESIDDVVAQHGATGDIDVLGIDIDGNDIWVWDACTACDPRLVIIEFNPMWGPDRRVAVPYDPSFDRHQHKSIYFGASLAAVAAMGERKGYRLVATTPGAANAYLLRDDVGTHVPALAPGDGWTQMTHVVWKRLLRDGAAGDPVAELLAYVKSERLPVENV
jgi:hypothetical protein